MEEKQAGPQSKTPAESLYLSQENLSHSVQAGNTARQAAGSSYPSSPFQPRSVSVLGCRAHSGMKRKGILGLHTVYEHASANKDQAGEQKWLGARGYSGSLRVTCELENTCMSLQMRVPGVVAVGPGSSYVQVPATGNTRTASEQIQHLSSAAGRLLQGVYTHTPTPRAPPAQTEVSQCSLCLPNPQHTHTVLIPACWDTLDTFWPQHQWALRLEAAAALLLWGCQTQHDVFSSKTK